MEDASSDASLDEEMRPGAVAMPGLFNVNPPKKTKNFTTMRRTGTYCTSSCHRNCHYHDSNPASSPLVVDRKGIRLLIGAALALLL
jgi:hypothetical protein